MDRVAVIGLGVTGRAVAAALKARGVGVVGADDRETEEMQRWAAQVDVPIGAASGPGLAGLLRGADAMLPTPGLPDAHPAFDAAREAAVPVLSEFDLAHMWDDRPIVAVTGTDGKTTVVTLIEQMLNASGTRAMAVGNTDTPLVAAIEDPTIEVFVVEASSFRLGHSAYFAPDVATWLNFGPDHLDAHTDLAAYETAKASIWARLEPSSVAIANRDDPVVLAHAERIEGAIVETFGADGNGAHGVVDGQLVLAGEPLVSIGELRRSLPHDLLNGLAAGASAVRLGACRSAIAEVLRTFAGLPHRVQVVGEIDGVQFVNDSKATTPHAAATAVQAFDSVILLAGGRNKALDLTSLAVHADRIRHVVALGEAAADIEAVFAGIVDTTPAESMIEALDIAVAQASAGDVVLLSPACASYDWYGSYRERGEDFIRLVHDRIESSSA